MFEVTIVTKGAMILTAVNNSSYCQHPKSFVPFTKLTYMIESARKEGKKRR